MKSLELAIELDAASSEMEYNHVVSDWKLLSDAATMLRQQQAEIEALKKDNKELHAIAQRMAMAESDARKSLQWFKDAKERQSEPLIGDLRINMDLDQQTEIFDGKQWSLLKYPVKELTDEEIREVAKDVEYESYAQWKYEFAKAILRKAQEK